MTLLLMNNGLTGWMLRALTSVMPARAATAIHIPVTLVVIALLALISYYVCKHILTPLVHLLTRKTDTEWDEDLLNQRLLNTTSQLAPALIVAYLLPGVAGSHAGWTLWLTKLTQFYMVWVSVKLINVFVQNLYTGFDRREMMREQNLSVIVQAVKLVMILVGVIVGLSILFDRSPFAVLTALGASAAILMLVFKDTIMGLVAGVQLSANGMLKRGDWIISDKAHANGEVLDVKLTTVKVRNWDNSVTTIPPYALISDSFQNYQNMRRVGARRVARSIYIDLNTIGFLTTEQIEALRERGWLEGLDEPQAGSTVNISLLRRYLEYYLSHHPEVRLKDKSNPAIFMMVRQLQPTAQGLPLELYFFTSRTNWKRYEALQSDIFDYVYAILPHFGLRMYQAPAGSDFAPAR